MATMISPGGADARASQAHLTSPATKFGAHPQEAHHE